jgi:hypothetical protein
MRRRLLLLTMVLIVSLVFVACGGEKEGTVPKVDGITLSTAEKAQVLALARHHLGDGPAPTAEKRALKAVYDKSPRGVFVTVTKAHDAADTGFGWGKTIAQAVRAAADDVKGRVTIEQVKAGHIRVDVINKTRKRRTTNDGEKWGIDVAKEGAMFPTEPMIAVLGQEVRDWGVINRKGRLSPSQFKRLAQHRGISNPVRRQIIRDKKMRYVTFDAHSFMEGADGQVTALRKGNYVDGFEPTAENLYKTIDGVGKYFTQCVKDDGSFDYRYYPQTDSSSRDYNELRHAGTAFSMMQIYEITGDSELLEAVKRALGWLAKHTRGPDANDRKKYDWQGLNNIGFDYAKLGGSGLSLLAFGWYTRATGDLQYLPLMQGYGRFVDYMMLDNGDVRHRYYYAEKDKDKPVKPVLYYPGEAFFGLATLYTLDGDMKWIDVASKGIDFIADVRDKAKPDSRLPHDHWMAYAINNVHKVKPKESQVLHAWRLFHSMDEKFNREHPDPDYNGGYYTNPKMLTSVSTGCRLEATTSFCRLAERLGDKERMDKYFEVLQLGASFLMRLQYNDVNTMFFKNPDKPKGALMLSFWSPEIQIDFPQHSVSSLVETYLITKERAGEAVELPRLGALENRTKQAVGQ